jgi:hypothetical protein
MVQILPIGSTLWTEYKYNGTNWYDAATMANADATLIPCGQAFVFVNKGIPGTPDMLLLPKWYVHPPNLW